MCDQEIGPSRRLSVSVGFDGAGGGQIQIPWERLSGVTTVDRQLVEGSLFFRRRTPGHRLR